MIYLASPYSHPDPDVREQRFEAACAAAAALLRAGHRVYSPIAHSHPLTRYGLPGDWAFWERHDRWYLERCDEVVVLMLEGWDSSEGVQAEIDYATRLGKPVWYRAPVGPWPPKLAGAGEEDGDELTGKKAERAAQEGAGAC